MKCAMFYGPRDLRVEEVDKPIAGPGEVIIKNKVAVTCGTDVKAYLRGHPLITPPIPFGHEFSGEIAEVGKGVDSFEVGMPVVVHNTAMCGYCDSCKVGNYNSCNNKVTLRGGYSEYVKVPAEIVRASMFPKPVDMSFERAALLEPLCCALYGVAESNIKLGDTVVINGAGPIGLMQAKLCKLRGATVISCDMSEERLEVARKLGVDHTVNASKVGDQVAAVRSLTDKGRGVDVAIEASGLPDVWEKTILMARKGATVTLFGGCKPGTSITIDTELLHYSHLTIKGVFHTTPIHINQAYRILCAGVLDEHLFITGEFNIENVKNALETHAERKGIKNAIYFD